MITVQHDDTVKTRSICCANTRFRRFRSCAEREHHRQHQRRRRHAGGLRPIRHPAQPVSEVMGRAVPGARAERRNRSRLQTADARESARSSSRTRASRSACSPAKTSSAFSPPAPKSSVKTLQRRMKFSTERFTSAKKPTRRPARRSFRSIKPRPTRKTRVGEHKGFDYSRTVNPTRVALEKQLASLEDARFGSAFASGMAATSAVLNVLSAGDHVVVSDDLYGGTYRLFSHVLARYGLEFTYVDMTDLDAGARGGAAEHEDVLGRDADQSAAQAGRHRAPIAALAQARRARSSSSTTRSRRRIFSSRSPSAPTSSCTRRRSTSADTATSSAASRSRTIRHRTKSSGFTRTRSAAYPGRWMRG